MSHEKELEIRQQFLDEAQEYLATLDTALQGLAHQRLDLEQTNAALRVAHSLKGGAGMMGFQILSDLAHQLEDSLKVLKVQSPIEIDAELAELLLSAVACLHHVADCDRQNYPIEPDWFAENVQPIFDQLRSRLGEPQPETAASVLSLEDGQSLIPLLFETEVEGCLQRLEGLLSTPHPSGLREELQILVQELGGLGEMLQLPAFTHLCESVGQVLAGASTADEEQEIAQSALQTWRHAQAVILAGQLEQIPTEMEGHPAQTEFSPTQEHTPEPEYPQEHTHEQAPEEHAEPEILRPVSSHPSIAHVPVPIPEEEAQDSTVRVSVKLLNQLNDLFGELTIDRNGLDLYLKRLRSLSRTLHQRVQRLDQVNSRLRTSYDQDTFPSAVSNVPLKALSAASGSMPAFPNAKSDFDELEMDRYTDLHLLSQQVMETIVQIQEVSEDLELSLDETEQTARSLNKTARKLQSGLTKLRMRPLSDVVDRFPRALREWCLQYGKQARLDIIGGNLLIDRNILEALQDSLMHLVRNAFDHGIEDPQTRASYGKSSEGVIEIHATQSGNRTTIIVRDDGQGIPVEKIRSRAAQIGLDPALLAAASDTEVLSLIFEPGFSTRDQVTALSGRGVGMDVVRTHLKQVRGDVTVDTQVGLGTTFTLSLPVTLATVRVVLVESSGMLLALPTDAIAEVSLFDPEAILQTVGGEMMEYQGRAIQVLRLNRWIRFNCPRSPHDFETPPMIKNASVLVLQQGNQWVGVQVDRCWSDQEATVRRVEGMLPLPVGFSSCTILGDGRVVPLVNVSELLHWITTQDLASRASFPNTLPSGSQPLGSLPPELSPPPTESSFHSDLPTVLIVDDSINVRRFLALTLERAGYQVEQAKDGQEALERLSQGLSVRAIICDIEMPRLDGYGFLTKLKANPDLRHLPVAMLTSRSGEKHRQLAMQLGASAYFSKPYNEQVLLRTLEGLVHAQV